MLNFDLRYSLFGIAPVLTENLQLIFKTKVNPVQETLYDITTTSNNNLSRS